MEQSTERQGFYVIYRPKNERQRAKLAKFCEEVAMMSRRYLDSLPVDSFRVGELTEEEIEGIIERQCEFCGGTGEVYEDEYENGQLVGRGTIGPKTCVCRRSEPADFSGACGTNER